MRIVHWAVPLALVWAMVGLAKSDPPVTAGNVGPYVTEIRVGNPGGMGSGMTPSGGNWPAMTLVAVYPPSSDVGGDGNWSACCHAPTPGQDVVQPGGQIVYVLNAYASGQLYPYALFTFQFAQPVYWQGNVAQPVNYFTVGWNYNGQHGSDGNAFCGYDLPTGGSVGSYQVEESCNWYLDVNGGSPCSSSADICVAFQTACYTPAGSGWTCSAGPQNGEAALGQAEILSAENQSRPAPTYGENVLFPGPPSAGGYVAGLSAQDWGTRSAPP